VRIILPVALLALSAGSVATDRTATHGARLIISGRVTDSSTTPLAQVQVALSEKRVGAITGADGRYRIVVPDYAGEALTVLARRIGFAPGTHTIRPSADTVTLDFVLATSAISLNEVVVTGTAATIERRSLGSAVAHVSVAGSPPPTTTSDAKRQRVVEKEATAFGRRNADPGFNTEGYDVIAENPFLRTASTPRSTFSIDVDHASYSNVRRFLNGGNRPPRDAVRLEELINYFPYELPAPRGEDPVSISTEVGVAPWNTTHRLVRIGLRGRPIEVDALPPNNLVFLIDVSGSMQAENKLPLLKAAFRLLVNELRPQDRVAMVVYAGSAGLVLPPTRGDQKETILQAIDRLEAGGSTAGGAGIRLAYDVAKANHMDQGNNRVILASDGDFNVGTSSDAELVQLIEQRREQGTFLTVLGFGTGNVKDSKMEKLADKGNGNYAYVDNIMEARKVLVTEMGATLVTVAKDVKLQIEFNPTRVAAYRLLGYENRLLHDEDFTDDTKDAGELGAGHSVTALYEVIPPGAPDADSVRRADPLRYTRNAATSGRAGSSELLYVKLRYKQPTGRRSKELTHIVRDEVVANPSADFTFASAVAEFGMVLRDSPHKAKSSMDSVIVRAERTRAEDEYGYRAEFVRLATRAREIVAREAVASRDEQGRRER
jgi:Ca-activated chloride channel family protein